MLNFKKCPNCEYEWPRQDDFLCDPNLQMAGYQVHHTEVESGLLLFNHSCRSTIAISVESVKNLYNGKVYKRQASGTKECPDFCSHKDNFEFCPVECEFAYVREIMQIIKTWPKK
jgi:hypothetical protein